jgi:hypothetical protein
VSQNFEISLQNNKMGIKEKLRNLAKNILWRIGDKTTSIEEKIEICLKCGERFDEKIEAMVVLPCIHVLHLRCIGNGTCPEENCKTYAEEIIETIELEEILEKESEETIEEEEIIENIEKERMEVEEEILIREELIEEENQTGNRKRKRKGQESANKRQRKNDDRKEKLEQIIEELKKPIKTEWGEVELRELVEEGTVVELFCELERVREMNKETNRIAIKGYYNLGKKITEEIGGNNEKKAKRLLKKMINEVMGKLQWDNLPEDEKRRKRDKVRKKKNRALKICRLFQEIGEKRIRMVKSNMTNVLLNLTWEEIEYIIENIKME